jgi:hypothetical protein
MTCRPVFQYFWKRVKGCETAFDEKTTEKKVQVLRELKKIDDRIGRLKAEIESLSAAVAYSSITVTFVMPEYGYSGETIRLFPWIEKLDTVFCLH